jgi:hypothetical protein
MRSLSLWYPLPLFDLTLSFFLHHIWTPNLSLWTNSRKNMTLQTIFCRLKSTMQFFTQKHGEPLSETTRLTITLRSFLARYIS